MLVILFQDVQVEIGAFSYSKHVKVNSNPIVKVLTIGAEERAGAGAAAGAGNIFRQSFLNSLD